MYLYTAVFFPQIIPLTSGNVLNRNVTTQLIGQRSLH